jgi:LPS-assembly protein
LTFDTKRFVGFKKDTPIRLCQISRPDPIVIFVYFLLFTIHCSLFIVHCFAGELPTIITSDSLEYAKETSTYTAKGNVKIQRGDMVIESNEITYNEQISDVIATGNVRYKDPDISFTASRAELNFETKTGKLFDAELLYRKDNYHVSGRVIEKRGERAYFSTDATFTTCDALVPAWCFRGKNIDAIIGERLKAKDVSFRIKDIPVLYSPYLWAPILTERQTGFLMPVIDYSKSRGGHLNIPFFWAMAENRDATIIMDIYTKRGVGEGLEYRYIEPSDIKGKWWLYHIRDNELDKDFFEFRASHEQRSGDGISGFLNINLINEKDFYKEFSPYFEIHTSRFLESTGEISLPLGIESQRLPDSRVYLLSQYWIDLTNEIRTAPQKLPEIGYIINPTKAGYFWVSASATASNIWRDKGVYGQRLDIYPRISHNLGSDIVLSQSLGLRETAYSLYREEKSDKNLHRESLEYNFIAHTRLLKRFDSFTHILEPSAGYTLITNSENNLPMFDSTELFKRTSLIELSLLNRFFNNDGEILIFKASQGFDSYQGDRPFLPFRLEVGIKKPVSLRLDAAYDVHQGKVEGINSDLSAKLSDITISAGQRYNRQNDIMFYTTGIDLQPYKSLHLEGRLWYDAEEKEIKDITIRAKYLRQCWGLTMSYMKRPDDYTITVMFELKGFGSRKT